MSVLASTYPLMQFELDKFLLEFQQQNKMAEAGVGVVGPAAAYALVWEWGSARIQKPGPRTTWGTNPDGSRVVLSLQAPHGYIRVNEPLFIAALERALDKLSFSGTTPDEIHDELNQVAIATAKAIRQIIQEHVPVDTGQLHDEIRLIEPGDALLDEEEADATSLLVSNE